MKKATLKYVSTSALALALGSIPTIVHAQDVNGSTNADKNVIVVTGSYIRGTPEDAASPVDVYSAESLAQSGVSSPLEFIKNLPEVGSILGDSNLFSSTAQFNQGVSSVNLRGLGATRTLVLFNGRRTLTAPGASDGGFADTNFIPLFALDRIEILKDGAAATYGSDAIAGVANFVTKSGFEGVEMQGDYEFIKGSDNNHTSSILVGQNFGDMNIMAGFGWQHRSELRTTDRHYATLPYNINPSAWSGLNTPGLFVLPAGVGSIPRGPVSLQPDVGCGGLGGTPDGIICRFPLTPSFNLVEDEDRYQGYVQADVDLDDSLRFHGEFTYAQTDQKSVSMTPAFPPLQGPTGAAVGGGFSVDPSNPGVAAFVAQNGLTSTPAFIKISAWRPLGLLGNPLNPERGSSQQSFQSRGLRVSGGFEKEFSNKLRGQLYLTWANYERRRRVPDIVGSRMQDALNGLGGPNCDPATGTPGVGSCLWFNPFANAGPKNPTTGVANPFYVPGAENSIELVSYLQGTNGFTRKEDTFLVDLIFDGELGLDIGAGPIAWAFGGQYRDVSFSSRPPSPEANLDFNPCVILGDQSCIGNALDGVGSFIFSGGSRPEDLAQDVKAIFAEIKVPIRETLELTAAARFESYGGSIGSTFNPKGAIRWEPTDWLVLRGSAGTTFRGPLASQASSNSSTVLAGIGAARGNFKAVDVAGNPTNLGPEKAFSYNAGAVVDYGGFNFSVDYWSFDFKEEITTTDAQAIANSVVPIAGGLADCSNVFAPLITFAGGCVQGTTVGTDISRIFTQWVNGPKTKTTGLDFSASFTTEVGTGVFSIGANASHVLTYDVGDFNLNGTLLRPGFSAVGLANLDRSPGTIAAWRGNAYVNYNVDGLNLRYGVKYIDGVSDERCPALPAPCDTTNFGPTDFGRNIESYTQHDFHVTYDFSVGAANTQLQFSVENFTDQEPSSARVGFGYNPFIGNPLGRVWRMGAKVGF